jgi:hypothetical protein
MPKINEKLFLITLAVNNFNIQYGTKYKSKDFDIKSVPPNAGADRAYEIASISVEDFLRLRMYLTFGTMDNLSPYRLEVNRTHDQQEMDPVYVTNGYIDRSYKLTDEMEFNQLDIDEANLNLFITETGEGFLAEDGNYFTMD